MGRLFSQTSKSIRFGKNKKLYIIAAVMFFAVGTAVQMAAIKLTGGFFYAREMHSRIIFNDNRDIGFFKHNPPDSLLKFTTASSNGLRARFSLLLPAGIFVLPFCFAAWILAVCSRTPAHYFYENGYVRIRPPTFKLVSGNYPKV
jgi:hypothetical protein